MNYPALITIIICIIAAWVWIFYEGYTAPIEKDDEDITIDDLIN